MRTGTTEASRDRCRSVFVLRLLGDELAELREDLVLALCALLVIELGQRSFLVGAVDLVLFTQTHGFHASVSACVIKQRR